LLWLHPIQSVSESTVTQRCVAPPPRGDTGYATHFHSCQDG
jgi:hypothetical protein